MKNKYYLLIMAIGLVGCNDSPQDIQTKLNNPDYVGEVNGQKLYFTTINSDRIYFFKDSTNQPTSVNYMSGKVKKVVVMDGKEYDLIEK